MRKPRFWRCGGIRISRRAVQRATLWLALVAQVSVGLPIDVLARARTQQAVAQPPAKSAPPAPVHVNRTVPKVTPPGARPTFSAEPGDAEITNARIFGEPLVAIGRGTLRGENHALADAVTRYLDARNPENVLPFLGFLKTYPDSPWRASLLLNLGLVYRHTGYFLRALDVWEQAWLATKTGTDAKARAVADRAVGELFALNARLGRFERLDALFAETKDRVVTGPATEQITAAREGLWMMRNTPEKAFLCGPLAVDQVLAASRAGYVRDEKILQATSTQQGTSLAQMQKLAADLNLPLQMARRAPGAPVLLPAVMHWKAGHFAALIREADGKFLVRDPTFGDELWISRAALDEEATGYMLVKPQSRPDGSWPDGWRPVEQTEGEQVWGKGQTDGNNPDETYENDEQAAGDAGNGGGGGDPGNDGGSPNDEDPNNGNDNDNNDPSDDGDPPPKDDGSGDDGQDDGKGNDDPCDGMIRYAVHLMVVSLHLKDTPVGYRPPRGRSMAFRVSYSQREAHQPQVFTFSNLGPKWTFNWLSYVEDDPTNANATAYVAVRGGGRDTFQSFNPTLQAYAPDRRVHATLVRTSSSPIQYERRLPNGAVETYAQGDGALIAPRRVLLTASRDPRGNTVTYTYDSQLRMVAATDALGQVTTISYDDPADARHITKVTDPFARYATFEYDTSGRLAHITDVLGLRSDLTYDAGDFIVALTTPYGTTRFTKGENGQDRWLETVDPLGGRERVEYKSNAPVPVSDPTNQVPTGIDVINNFLNYRNTFFWSKRAMALAPRDPASAHRYHWLHTAGPLNQTSGVLESEQRPLEARVWYRYAGQSSSLTEGSGRRPTVKARVLDDGTTQTWKWDYNDQDHVTKRTDPLSRTRTYLYATNGLDLLEVRQTTGGANDLLVTYGNYTTGHRPQLVTDAAGQTTTLTYNTYGQVLTVTNAKSETTTYVYDSDGYRQSVTGPAVGATTTFAFDGYGRLHVITDRDGYALTTDYDALNRATRLTYPDGTYEEITYDRLDPTVLRDRLGRLTRMFYDARQEIVSTIDAAGHTTTAQWCVCGALDALQDGRGQKTSWDRDLLGRITRELRADATTATTYGYETTTSRLKSVTDAQAEVTTYTYNVDNTIQQVAYTNAAVATPTISYTYDATYRRHASMTDGTGTTVYTYNAVGTPGALQASSVDGPLANDTITYGYDELGRTISRAVAANSASRTFDPLGRIATETNTLGTFTYTYDGTSHRLASVAYPNGLSSTFAYFGNTVDRRLQTIHHKFSGGATLARFDYTYDAAGNVLTWDQSDGSTDTQWRYGYDVIDQLTAAAAWSTGVSPAKLKQFLYSYDNSGNREGLQTDDAATTATYDGLNRLVSQSPGGTLRFAGTISEPGQVSIQGRAATVTSANAFSGNVAVTPGTNTVEIVATDASGNARTNQYQVDVSGTTTSLAHDARGNMTAGDGRTFEWDARGELTAITIGTTRIDMSYDGWGRRVRLLTTIGGTVTSDRRFIWCGTMPCEERDASNTVVARMFSGGVSSASSKFYLRDHLGSVVAVADGTGAVVDRFAYGPFGERQQTVGTDEILSGYSGHMVEPHTGLHLTLRRALDTSRGRWLSEDPLGVRDGLNMYGYVGNNPLKYIDLFGRDTYIVNREIGGKAARSKYNPFTHTFIFTTDEKGDVEHTYSWGNTKNTRGWNKDQPEDMAAAKEALKNGQAAHVFPGDFDSAVDEVFNEFNDPKYEHQNWGLIGNCKEEAMDLLEAAAARRIGGGSKK